MGFGEIGSATIHDGTKTVRYLVRTQTKLAASIVPPNPW